MTDLNRNLDALYLAASKIASAEERADLLEEACGDDTTLRRQVEQRLQSDEQVGNFPDKTPAEQEAAIVPNASDENRAASLQAGLAAAFGEDQSVVVGSAGHSVLKSLAETINVPHVELRDGDRNDPITEPSSPRIPDGDADSRYKLQGEIARGGMGAIIKGRDNDLGRDLAIKVLLDKHKAKPEVIERFIEEAQIGAQLQHPGIAPVYELGQFADQRPFFSMKLVKGQTLSKLLTDRESPAADRGRFISIFEQVCQTMAYTHSRGVIHRDLKPANIMVGAFGEVQVMDWGLAKVLRAGGVAEEKKVRDKHRDQSVIQTRRSVGSDTSGSSGSAGSETQMGSVLGTPAYMPPEQALGEIDQLDQRADVFGLGAVLCQILTGKPPYAGDDAQQIYRMASRGKLTDCFSRLEACGADTELIGLAKHCLAAEPGDRPENANALSERVTGYLESVETKLREAELQRAAESARVVEERKRRRVQLALAASVLLMVGLGGGGWMWLERQQAERRTVATVKVNEALGEARLHQQLAKSAHEEEEDGLELIARELDQALSKAHDAVELAEQEDIDTALHGIATGLLAGLEKQATKAHELATRAAADRAFREGLERIRLGLAGGAGEESPQFETSSSGDGSNRRARGGAAFDTASADGLYERVFRERGLDVTVLPTAMAVTRISQSRIRESLITAMDNWVRALPKEADDENEPGLQSVAAERTRSKLLAIIDQVDDSDWRKELREALLAKDIDRLKELAEADEVRQQPPALIAWLGAALRDAKEYATSAAVLRQAHALQAGDFWLNHELSQSVLRGGQPLEGLGYARAAVAIRPHSSGAWWGLAVSLRIAERFDEAITAYRRAIEFDPKNVRARQGLGFTLYSQGNVDEAFTEYRMAIKIDSKYAKLHSDMGFMHWKQGQLNEAIAAYRKTIDLDSNDAWMHNRIGKVLKVQRKFDEAIAEYRTSIKLDPTSDASHNDLGLLLENQGRVDEAITEYRTAIELDPNMDYSHSNLGNALEKQHKLDEAIVEYRRAIDLNPKHASAHNGLGWVLCQQGKLDAAIASCRTAIGLDPEFPHPHNNLGIAMQRKGKLDAAIASCRTAIKLDPEFVIAHHNLGLFLEQHNKLDEAIAAYEEWIEVDQKDARPHRYIGFVLRKQGKLDEAITAFRKAIEIDPK